MNLHLLASAWSFGSLANALSQVRAQHFDGLEGPFPVSTTECREFARAWRAAATCYVAELCTGGSYAPSSLVPFEEHWLAFERGLPLAAEAGAQLVTCLAGSDSWPLSKTVDLYERAGALAHRYGLELSFETHRSRPTFNPWATQALLHAMPRLRLTCDFSHWCVVCERLLDDEPALELAIERARHVHARVGYAQGPQVPDPRAPEFEPALAQHERWWSRIWTALIERGDDELTMTPEFGPDGYLQLLPFTRQPVADLAELNVWMASRQRQRFVEWVRARSR